MKFETIKSRRKILLVTIVFVLVGLTLILNTTKAKYRTTERINIAKGNINYSLSDTNLMGVYLQDGEEYTSSDVIPDEGYELNSEKSYCKKGETILDTTINYDMTTKNLTITPITEKGTKCYLYFDEFNPYVARDTILANMQTITTRSSFSSTYTSSTTKTIFTAEDNDGTSYYFAGNPSDNWVKFGGFYWRIVRINGDGSIRLIYNGTSTTTAGTGTLALTNVAYNTSYDDNMYIGYMYTSGQVHGSGTSSNIKNKLDSWYNSNLESYADYIDKDAGFCNDRTPYTNTSGSTIGGGTGTTTTIYAAYIRISFKQQPSFKCADNNDLFTLTNSSKGNKKLSKPIGLITTDEIGYAGGLFYAQNSIYYLYNNQNYWTMSPTEFSNGISRVMYIASSAILSSDTVYATKGMRPVINLRSDVTFKSGGTGTSTNPYEIVT